MRALAAAARWAFVALFARLRRRTVRPLAIEDAPAVEAGNSLLGPPALILHGKQADCEEAGALRAATPRSHCSPQDADSDADGGDIGVAHTSEALGASSETLALEPAAAKVTQEAQTGESQAEVKQSRFVESGEEELLRGCIENSLPSCSDTQENEKQLHSIEDADATGLRLLWQHAKRFEEAEASLAAASAAHRRHNNLLTDLRARRASVKDNDFFNAVQKADLDNNVECAKKKAKASYERVMRAQAEIEAVQKLLRLALAERDHPVGGQTFGESKDGLRSPQAAGDVLPPQLNVTPPTGSQMRAARLAISPCTASPSAAPVAVLAEMARKGSMSVRRSPQPPAAVEATLAPLPQEAATGAAQFKGKGIKRGLQPADDESAEEVSTLSTAASGSSAAWVVFWDVQGPEHAGGGDVGIPAMRSGAASSQAPAKRDGIRSLAPALGDAAEQSTNGNCKQTKRRKWYKDTLNPNLEETTDAGGANGRKEELLLCLFNQGSADEIAELKGLNKRDAQRILARRSQEAGKGSFHNLAQLPGVLGRKISIAKLLRDNAVP